MRPLNSDLENWMSQLPGELRNTPIICLAIPGTHNSFTNNISTKSKVAPDAEKPLQTFKFLGPCVTYFVAKWSRTQSQFAVEQLKHGIRYFDLRFSTKDGDEKFYFVHGLFSNEVKPVLKEINGFLNDHPNEIIILDCQHFYAFKKEDHYQLIQMIKDIFGEKLLPYMQPDLITLDYMTEQNNYQVICLYRNGSSDNVPFLWNCMQSSFSFPSPWHNTSSSEKLLDKLNNGIEHRPQNTGYISQCILTPKGWFIARNLFSNLKRKCKSNLNTNKYVWLKSLAPGKRGVNIVITDFVELHDYKFAKEVIALNEKLLIPDDDKSIDFDNLEWIDSDTVYNTLEYCRNFS